MMLSYSRALQWSSKKPIYINVNGMLTFVKKDANTVEVWHQTWDDNPRKGFRVWEPKKTETISVDEAVRRMIKIEEGIARRDADAQEGRRQAITWEEYCQAVQGKYVLDDGLTFIVEENGDVLDDVKNFLFGLPFKAAEENWDQSQLRSWLREEFEEFLENED